MKTGPKLDDDNVAALRAQVSTARWERIEQEARPRALVYEAVAKCRQR